MKRTIWKPIIIIISILSLSAIILFPIFLNNHQRNIVAPAIIDDIPGSEPPYHFDYSWTEDHPYVAHAFGSILGDSYTNSREAFLLNYQLGHRVFEVDFSITDDGHTVAAHDANHWRESTTTYEPIDFIKASDSPQAFTYNNFMSSLWYGKYHPLDLTQLLQIMANYPDIYIVTDTKYYDQEHVTQQFSDFLSAAKQIDTALLDRFIIQIYRPEMLDQIMQIYPWKSVIYTLYNNPDWTTENVLEFSQQSGVKLITLAGAWANEHNVQVWQSASIQVAAHTVNQLNYANQLHALGVKLLYTDFLLP